jgi:hypothetical protein
MENRNGVWHVEIDGEYFALTSQASQAFDNSLLRKQGRDQYQSTKTRKIAEADQKAKDDFTRRYVDAVNGKQ